MPASPTPPAGHGHSIQPIDPGSDFARQAARVDRLTADRELVERVMWRGYAGPEWERFRTALAEYGIAVLRAWIISGRVFVECRRKGFGSIVQRRRATPDDALGLAGETVAVALVFFRDQVLIPGRWDMRKGASLNTFFVGACIRNFPNVYRRHDGSEIARYLAREAHVEEEVLMVGDPAPFNRPDRRYELKDAVRSIDDAIVREVLLGDAVGYTQAETAARLGKTRWTVEGRMRRYRARNG